MGVFFWFLLVCLSFTTRRVSTWKEYTWNYYMFQSKKLPLCFCSISKIHIVVVYNSVLSYHVSDTAIASNISVIDAERMQLSFTVAVKPWAFKCFWNCLRMERNIVEMTLGIRFTSAACLCVQIYLRINVIK